MVYLPPEDYDPKAVSRETSSQGRRPYSPQPFGKLTGVNPLTERTYSQTLGDQIADLIVGAGGNSQVAGDIGRRGSELLNWTGLVGALSGTDEAQRAGKAGDYTGMAMSALGAVPGMGKAGKAAGEAGGAGIRAMKDEIARLMSDIKLRRPLGEMSHIAEKTTDLTPVKPIHPDDLVKQGAKIIGGPGDRTPAGQQLTHINEQKLDRPIDQGGGRDFGRSIEGQGPDSLIWKSGDQVIGGFGKKASEAGKEGAPVMFAPITMGWKSGDFSGMQADAVIEMMKTAPMTTENVKLLEEALRAMTPDRGMVMPDFKAMHKDPDLRMDWLTNAGTGRTNLSRVMDSAKWRDMGAPDIPSIRKANIAPEQLDTPFGSTGSVMYEADPAGRVVKDPVYKRPDYSTGLGGVPNAQPVGFASEIPADLMWPDAVAKMRANVASRGRDPASLTMNNIVDAIGKQKPIQEATPEWRDNIMRFAERHGMPLAIAAGMLTAQQAKDEFGFSGGDDAL